MLDDNSMPCSPPTLKGLARAAVLEMTRAYLQEPPSVPDKVANYLIALVDEHLFGPAPVPAKRLCWIDWCEDYALPGESWCALHDPARNGHSAAALDRLDRDISTGDQLLAEVKEEIKAHTNGFQPSEDMSEIHDFSAPTDLSETSETSDRALLNQAEQILETREEAYSRLGEAPAAPRATHQPTRHEAALQRARDYILDAHRKKVPISTIVARVTGFVDMSRSQADTLVFKTIKEAEVQPVSSASKPLDLTGGGNGSLSASEQEAKRREDGAWSVAKSAAKKAGKPLDEAEYRQRYRDRRAAAAGGAR